MYNIIISNFLFFLAYQVFIISRFIQISCLRGKTDKSKLYSIIQFELNKKRKRKIIIKKK